MKMLIEEVIKFQHKNHQDFISTMWDGKENNPYDDAFCESIRLLEKLSTIEQIMLKYNADWYADYDNGVPDCEILEAIWNVIQDNGLDIDIEQDYRKGQADMQEFVENRCRELGIDYIPIFTCNSADE